MKEIRIIDFRRTGSSSKASNEIIKRMIEKNEPDTDAAHVMNNQLLRLYYKIGALDNEEAAAILRYIETKNQEMNVKDNLWNMCRSLSGNPVVLKVVERMIDDCITK